MPPRLTVIGPDLDLGPGPVRQVAPVAVQLHVAAASALRRDLARSRDEIAASGPTLPGLGSEEPLVGLEAGQVDRLGALLTAAGAPVRRGQGSTLSGAARPPSGSSAGGSACRSV